MANKLKSGWAAKLFAKWLLRWAWFWCSCLKDGWRNDSTRITRIAIPRSLGGSYGLISRHSTTTSFTFSSQAYCSAIYISITIARSRDNDGQFSNSLASHLRLFCQRSTFSKCRENNDEWSIISSNLLPLPKQELLTLCVILMSDVGCFIRRRLMKANLRLFCQTHYLWLPTQ